MYTQDKSSPHTMAIIQKRTTRHTHIHTKYQFRVVSSTITQIHVFGLWEKVLMEFPCRYWENMQTQKSL